MEVSFCSICNDKILSRRIAFFWKLVCVTAASDGAWIAFSETDDQALKFIHILEKKLFLISSDYEDKILVKPQGIYQKENNEYVVCLCPSEHFEHISNYE